MHLSNPLYTSFFLATLVWSGSFEVGGLKVVNNDEYGCVMEVGFCSIYGLIDD